jgi:hypothetical protein
MSLFEERLADLPLVIEGYALERLERDISSAFTRVSTVIRMRGGGQEGVGEDVTYDAADHDALQAAGPALPLAGEWTLGSFCNHVEGLELWPKPPVREPSRLYRVWGYESTALDLALRQAGTSLHAAVGREPRPVRSWCRCAWASRRRSTRSRAGWRPTRTCASSSTGRPTGATS